MAVGGVLNYFLIEWGAYRRNLYPRIQQYFALKLILPSSYNHLRIRCIKIQ